jgi:hypothetical protein
MAESATGNGEHFPGGNYDRNKETLESDLNNQCPEEFSSGAFYGHELKIS